MAVNSSHVKGGEWPDGVGASVHSSAAERFAKPRTVGTVRLVRIPPTTVHKLEPRATRGLPSHTPWEQGLRIYTLNLSSRGLMFSCCCGVVIWKM
ncbi:hypothetical protein AVEN_55129-1 [Araneus ventricosus]|uniref:Uncharacterized protein n=1 Tax=Araneus ventricosus TaxID=182803 RepID=A0A4Y2U607_ARAVE|nr:hypothetical protein AVEN_55129-1 [Araneus ventricosus]